MKKKLNAASPGSLNLTALRNIILSLSRARVNHTNDFAHMEIDDGFKTMDTKNGTNEGLNENVYGVH